MTVDVKFENRYVVLKRADLNEFCSDRERSTLEAFDMKIRKRRCEAGRGRLQCVVIESDWPEFEPTVKRLWSRIVAEQQKGPEVDLGKAPSPFDQAAGKLLRQAYYPEEVGAAVAEVIKALSELLDLGQPDPSAGADAQAAFWRATELRRRLAR